MLKERGSTILGGKEVKDLTGNGDGGKSDSGGVIPAVVDEFGQSS